MSFNYETYRHHLTPLALTPAQENAIMDLMWKTMQTSAERAWGLSPLQQISHEDGDFSLRNDAGDLDSNAIILSDNFINSTTAHAEERIH